MSARRLTSYWGRKSFLRPSERLGLGREPAKLLIFRLVLVHPIHRLVKPLASFRLIAQPPMGHGQEEPIAGVAAGIEFHGLFQCRDRGFPISGAILGLAQRSPAIPGLRR